jgi:hypothetical protein
VTVMRPGIVSTISRKVSSLTPTALWSCTPAF